MAKRKSKKSSIYSSQFILVSISSLFFSASYNMLIPELPAYLTNLGGVEYIGLIIALFTLTAGFSRPFSGKLTDTIGRKPVMLFGAIVCLICGCLYPIFTTITGFLLIRLIHGFSTGFTPTAAATYVSDIVKHERLGEAMGIQGIMFSTGLALGPALGSWIKLYFSYDILFLSSSMIALIAFLLMLNLGETLKRKRTFNFRLLKISKNDIIAREAIPAGVITLLSYITFGVVLTTIPDWSEHIGLANKGVFFLVFTVSSLLVRFLAGRLSDSYGRTGIIVFGLVFLLISTFLMGFLKTANGLMSAAALYGIAMGIISPTISAWTIDLSLSNQKGKAMATMYIALEIGIGLGALSSGWYYQGNTNNIPLIMYACTGMTFLALCYMYVIKMGIVKKLLINLRLRFSDMNR